MSGVMTVALSVCERRAELSRWDGVIRTRQGLQCMMQCTCVHMYTNTHTQRLVVTPIHTQEVTASQRSVYLYL